MIRFVIDPTYVREAVLSGQRLMVEIYGDKLQYRKVTVVPKNA